MKTIEVTPEWVLTELPHMHVADGKGNMSFYTDIVTDVRWITLALNTLGIEFQSYDQSDNQVVFFWFEVVIKDFKEHCPELYFEWMQDNEDAKIDRTVDGAFEQFFVENNDGCEPRIEWATRKLKSYLEDFCKANGQSLSWAMIENQNNPKLKEYLLSRNLSTTTIGQYIKAKRLFLQWCLENHYLDNTPWVAH